MRVLIAGCGYVGSALARELVAAGHEVVGLRRDATGLPDGVTGFAADLTDPATLADLPEVDVVAVTVAAGGRSEAAYEAAYVTALANLRDRLAAHEAPPTRWVFTSSTAVYGDAGGDWIDEDTPTTPEGFSGRILLRGEAIVRDAPWTGVVLRLGGIYGPGRTRLVDQVRAGEATIPPTPTYTNRIHRDDCAGALHHLLTLPDPDPVYVGVDHDPAERADVLRWLADRLDAPDPPHADTASTRGNKRARNDRLVASGYVFRHPTFREGYAAMLAPGD